MLEPPIKAHPELSMHLCCPVAVARSMRCDGVHYTDSSIVMSDDACGLVKVLRYKYPNKIELLRPGPFSCQVCKFYCFRFFQPFGGQIRNPHEKLHNPIRNSSKSELSGPISCRGSERVGNCEGLLQSQRELLLGGAGDRARRSVRVPRSFRREVRFRSDEPWRPRSPLLVPEQGGPRDRARMKEK